jgi:phosphatidylserine/phosphatidylglycerophosphate/cardiolipin synthase-like enzyme
VDALSGDWSPSGTFSPSSGNDVDVLIDGAEALARCADALEQARERVLLAGWHFAPGFRLRKDGPTLRDLLGDLAGRVDVRMLAWAGAPLPLFHPDRGEVREAREALVAGTPIRYVLDRRERPFHCHHEKLVVVDDEVAFVGGIDLTSYAGDRLDTPDHPVREGVGWHDAAAQVRGPVVADVAAHVLLRWRELTGEGDAAPAPPPAAGEHDVQLVRTVPERVYDGLRRGEFSILEAYLGALRSAERLVYLENQFLWSPEIVTVLADKLRRPPTDGFRLVVLLPARANDGQEDTRGQLAVLEEADGGAGRLLACCLYQRGPRPRPVYVHAKIGIVDDRWLTLGSANLNEHSLFNDTEVNLVVPDATLARATRLRLWGEHLGQRIDPEADPTDLVDTVWRPLAEEQLRRRQAGEPQTHHLVRLSKSSRRGRALLGPINGLLVDG